MRRYTVLKLQNDSRIRFSLMTLLHSVQAPVMLLKTDPLHRSSDLRPHLSLLPYARHPHLLQLWDPS